MNSVITTLECKLAELESEFLKITNSVVSQQLHIGIIAHKKAINILSGCTFCQKIADNPIWFYDRAICPACAERIRTDNPFGMGK